LDNKPTKIVIKRSCPWMDQLVKKYPAQVSIYQVSQLRKMKMFRHSEVPEH